MVSCRRPAGIERPAAAYDQIAMSRPRSELARCGAALSRRFPHASTPGSRLRCVASSTSGMALVRARQDAFSLRLATRAGGIAARPGVSGRVHVRTNQCLTNGVERSPLAVKRQCSALRRVRVVPAAMVLFPGFAIAYRIRKRQFRLGRAHRRRRSMKADWIRALRGAWPGRIPPRAGRSPPSERIRDGSTSWRSTR